jgi:hypothetical protein
MMGMSEFTQSLRLAFHRMSSGQWISKNSNINGENEALRGMANQLFSEPTRKRKEYFHSMGATTRTVCLQLQKFFRKRRMLI